MELLALFRVTFRFHTTPLGLQLSLSAIEEHIVVAIFRVFWSRAHVGCRASRELDSSSY